MISGLRDVAWMDDANCKGADVEMFFMFGGRSVYSPAWYTNRRVIDMFCSTCPVREECLEYALRVPNTVGVWGGKTREQREAIKQTAKEKAR